MNKNKAIIIESDDWEGLFINGKLVEEGHSLNQGESRIKYFKKISKIYNFDIENLYEFYIEEDDEDYLYKNGSFPLNINELKGNYEL